MNGKRYDANNRITQLASAGKSINFAYDAAGRKTGALYPNTLAGTYVYDTAGRLTLNLLSNADGSAKSYDRYTYDNVGNRTSVKKYDSQADPVADKALLTKNGAIMSHRHNDANQVTAAGRMTFTYDNNGSMLTKTDADASLNVSYTYDYEGRLVRADKNEGGVITTSSYTYDPLGRRLTKTVYENAILTRDVRYVYDREDILVENRNDLEPGATQGYVLNVHGPGIDEPVAYTNNGQMYFYHADGLWSIKLITDESGAVARRYGYDAYGNINATLTDRPYTYAGREYDAETRLYYYRARYYDSVIGRFTQKDPIGFAGGDVNLYAYVGNNPVNWVDPYGLYSWGEFGYDAANAIVGFGDGISRVLTFGLYSTSDVRKSFGINGGFDPCSAAYSYGKYSGYMWGAVTLWTAGLNGGPNSVFWAGRGASAAADTLGTTIAKTPIGAILNKLGVENQLLWGAASATFAANASGTANAVIRHVAPESLWLVERAILNWRGIPIVFH